MTPQEQELVKKLDQEVKNLSILMQHTEVGDSLTLKDIRHYLYLLNKEVKEVEIDKQIIKEISRLFIAEKADIGLIAAINSWKDTISDNDVLLMVKAYKDLNIRQEDDQPQPKVDTERQSVRISNDIRLQNPPY